MLRLPHPETSFDKFRSFSSFIRQEAKQNSADCISKRKGSNSADLRNISLKEARQIRPSSSIGNYQCRKQKQASHNLNALYSQQLISPCVKNFHYYINEADINRLDCKIMANSYLYKLHNCRLEPCKISSISIRSKSTASHFHDIHEDKSFQKYVSSYFSHSFGPRKGSFHTKVRGRGSRQKRTALELKKEDMIEPWDITDEIERYREDNDSKRLN